MLLTRDQLLSYVIQKSLTFIDFCRIVSLEFKATLYLFKS